MTVADSSSSDCYINEFNGENSSHNYSRPPERDKCLVLIDGVSTWHFLQ